METIDRSKTYSFPYAFRVRYLGPTNYRPSRFKASIDWCDTKVSITKSFDYGKDIVDNELSAALECFEKLADTLPHVNMRADSFNRARRVEIPGSHDVLVILIRPDDI